MIRESLDYEMVLKRKFIREPAKSRVIYYKVSKSNNAANQNMKECMILESNKLNKNSWNKHAERYQHNAEFSFDKVDYGSVKCATEENLHLIGDVKGKKILELGCGCANCGIALAKKGAIVTCVDISEEQIRYAIQNAQRETVDIQFIVSSMESFELVENHYDVVISMAALGYIKDLQKIFNMVYKILKHKGIFVFSLPDAIYAAITAKYLWDDPVEQHSYFYTGPEKWKWEDDDDFEFVSYRRPVSDYINMLVDAGFNINRLYQLQDNYEEIGGKGEFNELYPNLIVFKVTKNTPL